MREPPGWWYEEVPMHRSAVRYLWYGLAKTTRGSYDVAKRSYQTHCLQTGVYRLSADFNSLTGWVAILGDQNMKAKSIKAYLTGLRSHHIDIGYTGKDIEVFGHPALQRIINGIRRLHPEIGNQRGVGL